MNRQKKTSVFLFFTVIFLATACLPTEEDFRTQSPLLGALERKSGLITYVGADGNIYTINQAGGNEVAVTTDASDTRFYSLPAWSRDSEKLAFFALSNMEDDTVISSLYTAAPDGSDMVELYTSETNRIIYFYWAPDDQNISFLTTASAGVLLQQVSASGGEPQMLDAAPEELYWDWAPDGRRLFLHSKGDARDIRLSFLTPRERVIEERMDIQPITFRAPAWSPDGQQLLLAVEKESEDKALLLLDDKGQTQESLIQLREEVTAAAFSWAPNGERVAYISGTPVSENGAIFGPLRTLDIENPNHVIKTKAETVLAFYWSPDSSKLAYFVPTAAPASDSNEEPIRLLSLHVLDVDSGLSKRITVLQPTAEFLLQIIPFFDQYSRSTTIWSPDSKNLVVTSYVDNEVPKVLVVPASGDLAPRLVAEGALAIWSWE